MEPTPERIIYNQTMPHYFLGREHNFGQTIFFCLIEIRVHLLELPMSGDLYKNVPIAADRVIVDTVLRIDYWRP